VVRRSALQLVTRKHYRLPRRVSLSPRRDPKPGHKPGFFFSSSCGWDLPLPTSLQEE